MRGEEGIFMRFAEGTSNVKNVRPTGLVKANTDTRAKIAFQYDETAIDSGMTIALDAVSGFLEWNSSAKRSVGLISVPVSFNFHDAALVTS